jgi:hypothetical protein
MVVRISHLTCNYTEFLPPKPPLSISAKAPSQAFYTEFFPHKTPKTVLLPNIKVGYNADSTGRANHYQYTRLFLAGQSSFIPAIDISRALFTVIFFP